MLRNILLYDGQCGLCDRVVQFVLRHDRRDQFRFAPLQSDFARAILERHRYDSSNLATVVLVLDFDHPAERLLVRYDAALGVLARLGGFWRMLAFVGRCCPRLIRDLIYDGIARNRYRIFGRHEQCLLPNAAQRQKFLAEPFAE